MAMLSIFCFHGYAQDDFSYITGRTIFPILSKYKSSSANAEFIAAEAIDGNLSAPKIPHYYRAQKMWYFNNSTPNFIQADDFVGGGVQNWFISFNYISQTDGNSGTWNSGASTQQFVFHPGKHYNEQHLLYAFLWQWVDFDQKTGDLYLVDVTNMKIVALLASDFSGMDNAHINVFANLYRDQSEMLVITDKKTFLVYNELPSETSAFSSTKANSQKQETYDISGRKIRTPQKGINIVNEKKYIVK